MKAGVFLIEVERRGLAHRPRPAEPAESMDGDATLRPLARPNAPQEPSGEQETACEWHRNGEPENDHGNWLRNLKDFVPETKSECKGIPQQKNNSHQGHYVRRNDCEPEHAAAAPPRPSLSRFWATACAAQNLHGRERHLNATFRPRSFLTPELVHLLPVPAMDAFPHRSASRTSSGCATPS